MNSPKISIVIPSFNKVDFIENTLKSILDQDYKNLEVIIQDGGSTDGTLDIIKKYSNKVILESKNDKGQLDAINLGFRKATGDIVSFLNADDLYENGCLKKIAEAYNENPSALWFAGHGKIINKKGHEVGAFWTACKNFLADINSYFLLTATSNYLSQPSVFLTREAFEKYGPFTGVRGYVFEYEMWLKLGKIKMPVVIKENLSMFRLGGANTSSLFAKYIFQKDIEVVRKYSKSEIFVFFHWINNLVRIFANHFYE